MVVLELARLPRSQSPSYQLVKMNWISSVIMLLEASLLATRTLPLKKEWPPLVKKSRLK
jgi:hypothetical protein